jgi:hypothetical protein
MAIDTSNSYVAEHTRGASQDRLRAVIALLPFIRRYRRALRWLTRGRRYECTAECRITESLDNCAMHFQEHRWALIENFFAEDFYKELMAQWPGRYEFNPPITLEKSYDAGFYWNAKAGSEPPRKFRKYSALAKLLGYLRSSECSQRFSRVYGRGANLRCTSFLMHMTREGSQVVPHMDSYYRSKHPALNILMFVNGQGGRNGGGLAISRDNELKDVIVEARCLQNSALLYDVKANFYHGFKPLDKGKFRWSMSSEFRGVQIDR